VPSLQTLDVEQRARVAAYWWQRAEGEITSWVGFQHVLADLRAEGSPEAVVALAERAVEDEYRHALFCRDWAAHFGRVERDLPTPRSTEPITFRGATTDENRLLRIALCCLTETVGCFILRQVRPQLIDLELRRLNRRHLADELRHSRVGWGHLASLSEDKKATLRRWLPALLRVSEHTCCSGPEEDHEDLVPFGYFTPRVLRAAYNQALAEVIQPGLAHLGFTEPS
jgi:hypothetical protein